MNAHIQALAAILTKNEISFLSNPFVDNQIATRQDRYFAASVIEDGPYLEVFVEARRMGRERAMSNYHFIKDFKMDEFGVKRGCTADMAFLIIQAVEMINELDFETYMQVETAHKRVSSYFEGRTDEF